MFAAIKKAIFSTWTRPRLLNEVLSMKVDRDQQQQVEYRIYHIVALQHDVLILPKHSVFHLFLFRAI